MRGPTALVNRVHRLVEYVLVCFRSRQLTAPDKLTAGIVIQAIERVAGVRHSAPVTVKSTVSARLLREVTHVVEEAFLGAVSRYHVGNDDAVAILAEIAYRYTRAAAGAATVRWGRRGRWMNDGAGAGLDAPWRRWFTRLQ